MTRKKEGGALVMHEGTSLRKAARPDENERPVLSRGGASRQWLPSPRRGAIIVLVAVVTFVASLILATGAAWADVPPIRAFPSAGEAAPPADAISDPSACSGWYQQSSYGGLWPAGSTWWEYSCTYWWPGWGGATNANWWGQNTWTNYFYWDGAQPVSYGENFYDGYSDGWFMATYCNYWVDIVNGSYTGYGPISCDG
jgi:hypothetical protein